VAGDGVPIDSGVGVKTTGERPRLLVVGTGLIGTSVGLAAVAAGYDVWLEDRDPDRLSVAVSVGAGRPRPGDLDRVDIAVAAVSPASVGQVVHELISSSIASTVTHVASVQSDPQLQVENYAR
jgi:prephenate dehydrogenase